MSGSAWAMLIFGALVLYGGLGICIAIALRRKNKPQEAGSESERSEHQPGQNG
jgi:hypothetical protein